MITFPAMNMLGAGGPADPPDVIFGAALDGWWKTDTSVTFSGSPSRVSAWTSAEGDARNASPSATKPRYIASDTDGTPSIQFLLADSNNQYFTPGAPNITLKAEMTCFAFCKPDNTATTKIILYTPFSAHTFYGHKSTNKYPALDADQQAQADVTTWGAFRFAGSGSLGRRTYQVDERVEYTKVLSWSSSGLWQKLFGNTVPNANFIGNIKEIVIVEGYFTKASTEAGQMLAYWKSKYPSLVTY